MDFVERMDRTGHTVAGGWANTAMHLWKKCCEYDGIDPECSFAIFSEANPFPVFYQTAVDKYQEAKAGINAVGYVGLEIVNGKAQFPEALNNNGSFKRKKKGTKK